MGYRDTCGKRSYPKKDAQSARNRLRKRGAILRIYHCPKCNRWHLTHKLPTRHDLAERGEGANR